MAYHRPEDAHAGGRPVGLHDYHRLSRFCSPTPVFPVWQSWRLLIAVSPGSVGVFLQPWRFR